MRLALTHRSYLHATDVEGTLESNERLEYLGDSVLGLVCSEWLYRNKPDEHEGQLTKTKSLLVSKAILSRRALAMGLGRFVLLSHSEIESGGRQRLSILADAFEAVIGAIYLDQGLEAARHFITTWLLNEASDIVADKRHTNYKSLLQEYVQSAFHTHPVYRIRHEAGPDHLKQFTVEVMVGSRTLGDGRGKNKKEAEQSAARDALERVAEAAAKREGRRPGREGAPALASGREEGGREERGREDRGRPRGERERFGGRERGEGREGREAREGRFREERPREERGREDRPRPDRTRAERSWEDRGAEDRPREGREAREPREPREERSRDVRVREDRPRGERFAREERVREERPREEPVLEESPREETAEHADRPRGEEREGREGRERPERRRGGRRGRGERERRERPEGERVAAREERPREERPREERPRVERERAPRPSEPPAPVIVRTSEPEPAAAGATFGRKGKPNVRQMRRDPTVVAPAAEASQAVAEVPVATPVRHGPIGDADAWMRRDLPAPEVHIVEGESATPAGAPSDRYRVAESGPSGPRSRAAEREQDEQHL